MSEIHFIVEPAAEGGYLARAFGHDVITEADDFQALRQQVRDAILCHFDDTTRPTVTRLHCTCEK